MSIIFATLPLIVFSVFNLLGTHKDLVLPETVFFLVSVVIYIVVKKIGRNFFRLNSRMIFFGFVAVLLITFLIGLEAKGSKRWIDLLFFRIQPSELFKPFFILYLAEYFSQTAKKIDSFATFIKSFIYFSVPTLIIFKQPDLGNAVVFLIVYLVMLFFSSLPKKYFFYSLLVAILILPVGWFFLKSYQRARIVSFINPQSDQQGVAYNMTQAMITVGTGNFLGRGLGLGTQSRLQFLPENHTDFAFSSMTEQFGFFGGMLTILFYAVLCAIVMKKLVGLYYQNDEDAQGSYLYLVGFLTYFVVQVVVNVGMNLGIFPIAGIALPFISYGGSALVALMIGLALIP